MIKPTAQKSAQRAASTAKTVFIAAEPLSPIMNDATKSEAKTAVPIHFGMFDSLNAGNFGFKNRVIPEIYKEIKL